MKKKDYIKKFLIEVKSDIDENGIIFITKERSLYVGLKGLCDVTHSLIDTLAEYEITDLYTTFERKEKGIGRYPVVNYGFSEKLQKWFGWSHRGIYGFGIGSEVKFGDCAYLAPDKESYEKQAMNFWKDEDHLNMHISERTDEGFVIEWTYSNAVPNAQIRRTKGDIYCKYPKSYGRGEWKAETLEDAKQMAIDYAEHVA